MRGGQRKVQDQVHQVLAEDGASGAVLASVSAFFVFIFALLPYDSTQRTGCTARGCCRYAETVCLLLSEGFVVFSARCF